MTCTWKYHHMIHFAHSVVNFCGNYDGLAGPFKRNLAARCHLQLQAMHVFYYVAILQFFSRT